MAQPPMQLESPWTHRDDFEVGRERLLPDDEEGVGQVEAEEDDAAGRSGDVGAREQRRDEEAQHDGADLKRIVD